MFKMKQLGVAAALVLSAAGAMASNFRAADQVYIPAAAHAAGGSGTFISDVFVSNLSTDSSSVTVSVIYTPTGNGAQSQYFNDLFTLAAGERREFVDFIAAAKPNGLGLGGAQFGTLIFNACKAGADCTTSDDSGFNVNYRDIGVFSRIYSIPPNTTLAQNPPTTGQALSGIPWYNYVSSRQSNSGLGRVSITGLRNTGGVNAPGTYRGNIGLMNASQYSTTTIVVKLFNGATRQQIGDQYTVSLGPLNHVQPSVGQMFPAFNGPTATNAYVTVEQTNNVATNNAPAGCLSDGCPGFLAYASVLDNLSGDATTLESIYDRALSGEALTAIYGSSAGKPNIRRAVKNRG